MADRIVVPEHVKYREEAAGGLVYEHENYGYEDATLTTVSEPVIDVLEHVDQAGGCPRSALESEFGAETVRTLVDAGFLAHE